MSERAGLAVAVVGATSLVGETLLRVLEERAFPVASLSALAPERDAAGEVRFRGEPIEVAAIGRFDFGSIQLAFFCGSRDLSLQFAPRAAAAGCTVIDHSSSIYADEEVPLVVPEVNPHALARLGRGALVVNPNCSTVQLVLALKPILDAAGLERVQVATYQSVSGLGHEGIDELARQSIALLSGQGPVKPRLIPKPIAFNCVPQVGELLEGGQTLEEEMLAWQTRRILESPELAVNATAVRVPVFFGHSQAVTVTTGTKLSAEEARAVLANAPGVTVLEGKRAGSYPTAATEQANRDTVYVGRIRDDMSSDRGLNLWIVADNVRKGAATNSVQIAEALARGDG